MGMPGGRIAKAIRGGRRPRAGGAKPQEAVFFFFLIVPEARRWWVALPLSRFSGQAVRSGGTLVGETTMIQPLVIIRSEEHTSELQYIMRITYAVFCLKIKK